MIPRYSRPQMAAIWSDRSKYEIWLEIETLAAEAMEQLGQIPAGTSKVLRERGAFDIARIDEIEREVKHDVIASSRAWPSMSGRKRASCIRA